MSRPKVLAAMSGGVDSSVAALLLKEQGFDVTGVTMRLWSGGDSGDANGPARANKRCCSVEDVDDAADAASAIGIPHYVVNFEREFRAGVIDYFLGEYKRGPDAAPLHRLQRPGEVRPPARPGPRPRRGVPGDGALRPHPPE